MFHVNDEFTVSVIKLDVSSSPCWRVNETFAAEKKSFEKPFPIKRRRRDGKWWNLVKFSRDMQRARVMRFWIYYEHNGRGFEFTQWMNQLETFFIV